MPSVTELLEQRVDELEQQVKVLDEALVTACVILNALNVSSVDVETIKAWAIEEAKKRSCALSDMGGR